MKLEDMIETSRRHLIDKFGQKGYATEKMYFEDEEYKRFLEDIVLLTNNKELFRKKFLEVNEL